MRARLILALAAALALASAGARAATHYDPSAKLDITVTEVPLRTNAAGRMLMARIYQPNGPGPFPTVLDLHGGAWNAKDRHAEEPMDRALAASGLLVVAIDMTLAPEAPYPASVQDANYAVRWMKATLPAYVSFKLLGDLSCSILVSSLDCREFSAVDSWKSSGPSLE